MSLGKRFVAELTGTLVLVFTGCGAAIFGGNLGAEGVALAFGLAAAAMAYAFGAISGAHLNPAVSAAHAIAGKLPVKDLLAYAAAQLLGALLGSWLVHVVSTGRAGTLVALSTLASNGYGAHSPNQFGVVTCLLVETLIGFILALVVLSVGTRRAHAPAAVGATLALVHLLALPITNASANPARSTGPAVVSALVGNAEAWALGQLWLFWAGPITGGLLAGLVFDLVFNANVD